MYEQRDRSALIANLEAYREIHVYGLGDLAEPFWSRSRWWQHDGAVVGAIGLDPAGTEIAVYAITPDRPDTTVDLWAAVHDELPEIYSITGPFGLAERAVALGYQLHGAGEHLKMNFIATGALGDAGAVPAGLWHRALGPDDLGAIMALRASDPATSGYFNAAALGVAPVHGLFAGEALVGVAGIHVLSPELAVAAVGGVFVRADHRGRGAARYLTGCVVTELLARGIETIGLNVEAANHAARRAYERIGFRTVHRYFEAVLERATTVQTPSAVV